MSANGVNDAFVIETGIEADIAEQLHRQEVGQIRQQVQASKHKHDDVAVEEDANSQDNENENENDSNYLFPGDDIEDETSTSLSILRPEFHRLPIWQRPHPLIVIGAICITGISELAGTAAMLDLLRTICCRARYSGNDGEFTRDDRCDSPDIAGDIAQVMSYNAVIAGAAGLLLTPKFVAWSDRVGRRQVLLISNVFQAFGSSLVFLLYLFPDRFGIKAFYFSQIIGNLSGGPGTLSMVAKSYVSDAVRPVHRARYIAYMDAVMSVALAVGPSLGSFITKITGGITVVVAMACFAPVTFLIMLIFIPESRTLKARRASQASYVSSQQSEMEDESYGILSRFKSAINVFTPLKKLTFSNVESRRDRHNAWLLVFFLFSLSEVGTGVTGILLVYPEMVFGWTSVETGYLLTTLGSLRSINLIFLLPFLIKMLSKLWHLSIKRLDMVDTTVIRLALVGSSTGYVLLASAQSGVVFLIGIAVLAGTGSIMPVVMSALLKFVNKDEVGEVLGAVSFLTSIGMMTAPVLFMTIFKATANTQPNFAFKASVGLYATLFLVSAFMLPIRTEVEDESHVFRPPGVVYTRIGEDEDEYQGEEPDEHEEPAEIDPLEPSSSRA